jgi:hypothetical protein
MVMAHCLAREKRIILVEECFEVAKYIQGDCSGTLRLRGYDPFLG